MTPTEFDAGGGQTIAVYLSPDTGDQVDQDALFREIAADSAERVGRGQRIVSVSMSPRRPSPSCTRWPRLRPEPAPRRPQPRRRASASTSTSIVGSISAATTRSV